MALISLITGEKVKINGIFCIGRNYLEHIHELNNSKPDDPIIFTKPLAALTSAAEITLPSFSNNIHYETEILVLLGKGGKNIAVSDAMAHIQAYGIGLDLTARDLQTKAKQAGLPWALAKGFDGAACVSSFVPAKEVDTTQSITFSMTLNGVTIQQGDSTQMIFTIAEQIAYLSKFITLSAGDLLFTGTPKGVGPLHEGDEISLQLMDKVNAQFKVESS